MKRTADSSFGSRAWEEDERSVVQRLLEHKLGNEHIAVRPGAAGTKFVFVESWKAIELANSIFGFDGWSSQIVDITPDFVEDIPGGKYRVGVTAVVKVMLKDGTFHEDVGYGMNENKSKGCYLVVHTYFPGSAIENAKKSAVSDARKRALRVFGNALGNSIYDKEHIKKVKSKVKAAATSSVSYDKLRAAPPPPTTTSATPADTSSSSSSTTTTITTSSVPPAASDFQVVDSNLENEFFDEAMREGADPEVDDYNPPAGAGVPVGLPVSLPSPPKIESKPLLAPKLKLGSLQPPQLSTIQSSPLQLPQQNPTQTVQDGSPGNCSPPSGSPTFVAPPPLKLNPFSKPLPLSLKKPVLGLAGNGANAQKPQT